jgi:hypothetical protein
MSDERNKGQIEALQSLHTGLLEALRHREQEIFSYLAILVPALGGFVWLLLQGVGGDRVTAFVFGTLGVLLMLFLGATYSLSLGYNYRYITFQLAKIERFLGIEEAILQRWPRSPEQFERYTPKCLPPEIIKFFWSAFLIGTLLVTGAAIWVLWCPKPNHPIAAILVLVVGIPCFLGGYSIPRHFGRKFRDLLQAEKEPWPARTDLDLR